MLDTFDIGAVRKRCYIDIPIITKYRYVALDALLDKQYSLGSDICHLFGKRMFQNKFSDSYFLLQHGSKKRNREVLFSFTISEGLGISFTSHDTLSK